jgi:sugar diacid utilization regulator
VSAGTPIPAKQLRNYRALGRAAADEGVALRALLDLYLSAAWRLWPHLPPVHNAARDPDAVVVAGQVMLHAVDDVVAELAEGYQLARRLIVRAEESARREFVDDLLSATGTPGELVQRAVGVGLDLAAPHAVAVVRAARPFVDTDPDLARLERAILGSKGDADALVATKDGRAVVVFAAPDRAAVDGVIDSLSRVLRTRATRARDWRLTIGRPGNGPAAVAQSYREALEAFEIADRLRLEAPIVDARDLLVYRVLLRDRAGLADVVEDTLAALRSARGGASPLVATLCAYYDAGANATRCARAMHLSVRAVTYRLERVRALTGLDPDSAEDRLRLHVAALGARLLDWA